METAAFEQYVEHPVAAHATEVETDIPDGMMQVRFGDGERQTMT